MNGSSESKTGSSQAAQSGRSRWAGVWFALRMIEVRLRFVAILVVIGLVIGYWDTLQNYWDRWTRPTVATASNASSDTEFYCPMDPSVVRPGLEPNGAVPKCPICGMPLSLRKKGAPMTLPAGVVGRVALAPNQIKLAGIRTSEVGLREMTKSIRAVGRVVYDESLRSQIVSRVGGYVEKLVVDKTFMQVQKGDPLAEIYSPELYSAIQELKIASGISGSSLARMAREKIRLLGIDDAEIDALIRSDAAASRVIVRSPASGFVIQKTIQQGSNVSDGQMLFEVADLSAVWIEADIYERDVPLLRVGQEIEATVEAYPQHTFKGQVGLIYPELSSATRTTRVRFDVANKDLLLRSGMYATVELDTPLQETEPFQSLLVASKSTPSDPLQAISQQAICPVTGARLGSMGEPLPSKAKGRTVYLCCAGCEPALQREPDKYLSKISTVTDAGVLSVPETAVIDTGDQKIVYVEREEGVFEGVEVQLGPRSDGYYAVVSGLLPGDRVAAAGAFLIDAETRLNPAASASYFGASGSPGAGGMDSASMSSTGTNGNVASSGTAVSGDSHSDGKEPAQPLNNVSQTTDGAASSPATSEFATARLSAEELAEIGKLPAEDQLLAKQQVLCPITKEPLGSMGVPVKLVLKGQPVFLCCKGCVGRAQSKADSVLELVTKWRAANRQSQEATK